MWLGCLGVLLLSDSGPVSFLCCLRHYRGEHFQVSCYNLVGMDVLIPLLTMVGALWVGLLVFLWPLAGVEGLYLKVFSLASRPVFWSFCYMEQEFVRAFWSVPVGVSGLLTSQGTFQHVCWVLRSLVGLLFRVLGLFYMLCPAFLFVLSVRNR